MGRKGALALLAPALQVEPCRDGGTGLTGQHLAPPPPDWLRHLHLARSGRPHRETSSRTVREQPLGAQQWGPGELGLEAAGGRIVSFWNLLVSLLMGCGKEGIHVRVGGSFCLTGPPITLHTDHPGQSLLGRRRAVPSTSNQLDPQGRQGHGG